MGVKDVDKELLQKYLESDTDFGRFTRAAEVFGQTVDCIRYFVRRNLITIPPTSNKPYGEIVTDYIENFRAKTGVTPKMARRAKDPRSYLVEYARGRAKKFGLEFDLYASDISVPEACPVLGIPIVLNRGPGCHDNSPTLDRVDNDRGYTWDNVIVVSGKANRIKNDATVEDLRKVLGFYSRHEPPASRNPIELPKPRGQSSRKISKEQEVELRQLLDQGVSHSELAAKYNTTTATIYRVLRGRPPRIRH